jgi:hypothetical protein
LVLLLQAILCASSPLFRTIFEIDFDPNQSEDDDDDFEGKSEISVEEIHPKLPQ